VTHATLWEKPDSLSPWLAVDLGTLDGYDESAALGIAGYDNGELFIVGTSYTGDDSVAVLWVRQGGRSAMAYDLNDLIVGSLSDIVMFGATRIEFGGHESLLVVTGWGVEPGAPASKGRSGDPHAYVLVQEKEVTTVSETGTVATPLQISASPNPFNPSTVIRYSLPASRNVELVIHDVAGRLVSTLVNGNVPAGLHFARWNGRDQAGNPAYSGVYFARLKAGDKVVTRKITLVR